MSVVVATHSEKERLWGNITTSRRAEGRGGEGRGAVGGPNSPWLNELPALGAAAAGRRGIRPWKL